MRAGQVALGTNAFPSLVRRLRLHTVPVYDYALMTEPLTAEQLDAIGWAGRQGLDDMANQFHYFRLTARRPDPVGRLRRDLPLRPARRARRTTSGPRRSTCSPGSSSRRSRSWRACASRHRWGGAIDTCTRFCAFFGTAYAGRAAYALGYTGLGVGATRFGADVMLDLLDGVDTERTRLEMVRTKPLPFPPEPFAWTGIELTRRSCVGPRLRRENWCLGGFGSCDPPLFAQGGRVHPAGAAGRKVAAAQGNRGGAGQDDGQRP